MISPVDLRTLELTGWGDRAADVSQSEWLAAWQLAKVRNMIPYMRANSDYYAKSLSGVDESSIDSAEAFFCLPFTLPADVRTAPGSFLCTAARGVRRVATVPTSGSTGEPKRFSFTGRDIERTLDFFTHGMRSLTGEGKHVAILLSSATRDSIAALLVEALGRIGATASLYGRPLDMDEAAKVVGEAHCLVGLPADLLRLCRTHPELRPESVLLTADYIPRIAVLDIERTWGCKTYAHYGMTEVGYGLAVQCSCGGAHHLRHADVLVEVVDPHSGAPLPAGEEGEVVVTTFTHEAMPLLRYRTGDRASLEITPCPCGGLLPRLGRLTERIDGMVDLGGRETTQEELDEMVYACAAVRDYRAQLRREGDDCTLLLFVEADARIDRGAFERRMRALLPCRLEFSYDSLPPAGGVAKRRIEILQENAPVVGDDSLRT